MVKVKIFGAGSIGNHLAQASRRIGWEVSIVDVNAEALRRTREEIYPKRYGAWDPTIKLYEVKDAPSGGFDVIFVGTPPDLHLPVAVKILKEEPPRVLQIEKPFCSPTLEHLPEFMAVLKKRPETAVVVGFNHLLAQNTLKVEELAAQKKLGRILALDCEVRSNWKNILDAHPWLKGPEDSYLGFWRRGGGAGGEHIHGLNLWQHFVHLVGAGRVTEVSALFDIVKSGKAEYDASCFLNLVTEKGLMGRVAQDVITLPKKKFADLQFEHGRIEWHNDVTKTTDEVYLHEHGKDKLKFEITKSRADEFYHEIVHIKKILDNDISVKGSPIRLERGLDSMLVLAAAHRSFNDKKATRVDYSPYSIL